jgi:hypothetical protein
MNLNVQFQLAYQYDSEKHNFLYLEIMDNFMFAMLAHIHTVLLQLELQLSFHKLLKHVHCNVVYKILKHLKNIMHYRLYYCGEYNNTLVAFANANYGSGLDDIKSHSNYFHFFNKWTNTLDMYEATMCCLLSNINITYCYVLRLRFSRVAIIIFT